MSVKVMTVLPDNVHEALVKMAQDQRRTKSATLALVCEDHLREHDYLPKE